MVKKPNIYGGGAQTNANGLLFEQTTDLNDALRNAGYDVHGVNVFKNGKLIGYSLSKHNFYQHRIVILKNKSIKNLFPLLVLRLNTYMYFLIGLRKNNIEMSWIISNKLDAITIITNCH